MASIEVGRVCVKTAGREAGEKCASEGSPGKFISVDDISRQSGKDYDKNRVHFHEICEDECHGAYSKAYVKLYALAVGHEVCAVHQQQCRRAYQSHHHRPQPAEYSFYYHAVLMPLYELARIKHEEE